MTDGAEFYQAQEQQELEEYLETEVCPYCYEPRNGKQVCCGENHWTLGKELI